MSHTEFIRGNFVINITELSAYLCKGDGEVTANTVESHIHNSFEIYVNLSGNVSFMVENRLYKIKSGDVIITRPNEAHHCICHDRCAHDHFCMHFSSEMLNQALGGNFPDGNYVCLPDEQKEKLVELCYTLVGKSNKFKKVVAFFNLLDMIYGQKTQEYASLPADVDKCVNYINENLEKPITVKELSEISFVTVNTLERHFKASIGITPYEYIQNCRFAKAISILESGGTVSQAAEQSGFSDYSHFIALFKKKYGKTPLKYKKDGISGVF